MCLCVAYMFVGMYVCACMFVGMYVLSANSFTGTNQIRIAADDPSTISAEYVMVEPEVDIRTANQYARNN